MIEKMKYQNTGLHIGGLFRCCIATLSEFIKDHSQEDAEAGKVLTCVHCKEDSLILGEDGNWRWNQPTSQGPAHTR